MEPATLIALYLFWSVVAGAAGGGAMLGAMALIDRSGVPGRNMVAALGSLFTRSRDGAVRVGGLMHAIAAVLSGLVYTELLLAFGMTSWPGAVFAGAGLGLFHGIVVSLALVWLVADAHPLEEFRQAGPAVFLEHLIGHLVFGAVVGLVIAAAPL